MPILAGGDGRPAACCCCATSPSCASATACCCQQGRHDPRDPPPGEEQPADDLVAAAAAGAGGSTNPEAKAAVAESVRRIRTIALVHETLSREPGDDVTFIEIVRPLLRLAEEGLQSPDRPVRFTRRTATAGGIPADDRHAAVGRAHRAAAERRRPRLPGGQRRRRRSWCSCDNDDEQLRIDGRSTTGAALEPGFELDDGHRARPVDRAHARHHRARRHDRDAARLTEADCARRRARRSAGRARGTVVELDRAARRRSQRERTQLAVSSAQRRCWRRRRAGGGSPAAPPRSAAPDAGVLVGVEGELEALAASPRTRRTPAWRCRSARARCPWCRPGRTARGRCRGRGRDHARRSRRQRGRGWTQGSTR